MYQPGAQIQTASTAYGPSTRPDPAESDADSALQRLAGSNDFATIVVATVRAHMVRALQLAAVRALGVSLGGQSLMAATHARP
jgi:hypothetical protein